MTERVLWRLDAAVIPTTHAVPRGHQAELLVLTESRPSWEHIIEQAGWVDVDDPQFEIRDYQPLLEKIQRGREFRLRVRANPVSATKRPLKPSAAQEKRLAGERPRGVRVAQRTAAQQLEWFLQKAPRCGFEVPDQEMVQLIARDRLAFSKTSGDVTNRVVLTTATFDGVVRVSDVDLARRHLLGGVRGQRKGMAAV